MSALDDGIDEITKWGTSFDKNNIQASARDELAAARALIARAAVVMNDTGNDLNWPPLMPLAYAEMINELRGFSI